MQINIRFEFILILSIIILTTAVPVFLWGETWEPFSLEGQHVFELVIDPQNPENMFAITGPGDWGKDLLKTTDGGKIWRSILGDIRSPSCIAIDAIEPSNIYVGARKVVGHSQFGEITNGAMFKSTDAGETWDKGIMLLVDPGVTIHQIIVHPADPNTLYLVRSRLNSGLHRSQNGGKSWVKCSAQVNEVGKLVIDVDPRNPDVVYAWGSACWSFAAGKSKDGGMNFTRLNLPGDPENASSLTVAPNHPDTLYVMPYRGEPSVFRSIDGALTWEIFPTGLKYDFERLKVNPANLNLIYGITWGRDSMLFVSEYGGKSWRIFMDGMEGVKISNLTFHPKHPWILYACMYNGIYKIEHRIKPVSVSPDGIVRQLSGDTSVRPNKLYPKQSQIELLFPRCHSERSKA